MALALDYIHKPGIIEWLARRLPLPQWVCCRLQRHSTAEILTAYIEDVEFDADTRLYSLALKVRCCACGNVHLAEAETSDLLAMISLMACFEDGGNADMP